MKGIVKSILLFLWNKKYIGGKHTPEHKLIKAKTRWVNRKEKNQFKKEYKEIINKEFILRSKKRTKKGMDWHISLNPKKIKELNELIFD